MNVSEVKAMAPLADVYSLRDDGRYLIVVDRNIVPFISLRGIVDSLDEVGIPVVVLAVDGDPVTAINIYEDAPKSGIKVVSR